MPARRFTILYQRQRNITLERDVVGSVDDVLATAWGMLQDGSAKVAAIVEPGNLEFHIWHHRIVRWGQERAVQGAHGTHGGHGERAGRSPGRTAVQRTAA